MRAEIAKEKRRENLKLKQFKNFDKAAQSGDVPVTAGHVDLGADEYRGLMVGDELTIKGEKLEVTRVHEDEDGNVIGATLKDGPSYGVQEIGPDYVMLVDEFKPRQTKAGGEFVSEADIEAAKQELQSKSAPVSPPAPTGEANIPTAQLPDQQRGMVVQRGLVEMTNKKLDEYPFVNSTWTLKNINVDDALKNGGIKKPLTQIAQLQERRDRLSSENIS